MSNQHILNRLQSLRIGQGIEIVEADWQGTVSLSDYLDAEPGYAGRFSLHRVEKQRGWLIVRAE